MHAYLMPLACVSTAFLGALYQRIRAERHIQTERARQLETERIVSVLSAKQPGVWDQDELRQWTSAIAREFWSAPTPETIARLQGRVSPELLAAAQAHWPHGAVRRDFQVRLSGPVVFIHVVEGAPWGDRLIIQVKAEWEGRFFDRTGLALKHEKQKRFVSFHTWAHTDGFGWELQAIDKRPPLLVTPPTSVSCRLMPELAFEESLG
jgi:hypothetical protein